MTPLLWECLTFGLPQRGQSFSRTMADAHGANSNKIGVASQAPSRPLLSLCLILFDFALPPRPLQPSEGVSLAGPWLSAAPGALTMQHYHSFISPLFLSSRAVNFFSLVSSNVAFCKT
jgi:hypothetical protein